MNQTFDRPVWLQTSSCGLYVHIPFCDSKCGYCDFFSVAVKDRETKPLVERIMRELGARLAGNPHKIRTVFVGGGTPTILPLDQLAGLLHNLREMVRLETVEEFTVEANPATVDDAKADLLVRSGVNRISMGAQSFLPEELQTLERLHSPDDIPGSVAILRNNHVKRINLDLIFGIPGQTLASWAYSLRRAIDLEPDHIACYGLMYEPGTRLTAQRQSGRVVPCDENLEADMYLYTMETLADAGYRQYEISNFAQAGCECLHNLIYWRNGPYIGMGPSAVGCIDGRRMKNVPDVAGYIRMIDAQGHAEAETEVLDAAMLATEMLMMQLRLVEGLSVASFRKRIGMDPLVLLQEALARLVERGLVVVSDGRVALTDSGRLVGDAVIAELVNAFEDHDLLRLARAS